MAPPQDRVALHIQYNLTMLQLEGTRRTLLKTNKWEWRSNNPNWVVCEPTRNIWRIEVTDTTHWDLVQGALDELPLNAQVLAVSTLDRVPGNLYRRAGVVELFNTT